MQRQITSKYLGTSTELTVVMPLKQGLIEALGGTKTYATRLRLLLNTLNQIRKNSVEKKHVKAYTDPIERLRTINDFRWCIINNDTQLLLAVTFDSAWETYIRKIADDAGPLLDVILCHCEGYESYSTDLGYQKFAEWARKYQIETGFFYSATGELTVDDMQYLKQLERTQREHNDPADFDVAAARLYAADIEKTAQQTAADNQEAALQQALEVLYAMHQLHGFFPDRNDGGKDHLFLHSATKAILQKFNSENLSPKLREQHSEVLTWFERAPLKRRPPKLRDLKPEGQIQGDILSPYSGMTHSCLLLMRVLDRAKAAKFLEKLKVTKDGAAPVDIALNIGFTYQGLQNLGLDDAALAKFPMDFREGMEARAGILGDVRSNHPDNWNLPKSNWPLKSANKSTGKQADGDTVQLFTVDFVIQLQTKANGVAGDHKLIKGHPLLAKIEKIGKEPGVQILAVEPLRRYIDGQKQLRGHFGFRDGISQPEYDRDWDPAANPTPKGKDRHKTALGELLLGYPNNRRDSPSERDELMDNGSFLVLRKLKQNVAAFEDFLCQAEGIDSEILKAKMMGRYTDGKPLVPVDKKDKTLNNFDYSADPNGDMCPFQSHVRRTYPRTQNSTVPDPRILRRGFLYGPSRKDKQSQDDRGLIFMAYNASIAEQFEVIQRWVSGGNSTNVLSAQHDPFLGVPREKEKRTLRFLHDGKVKRFDLGDKPFVILEWGMYLFVPSLAGLAALAKQAAERAQNPVDDAARQELIEQGKALIKKLKLAEQYWSDKDIVSQWKAVLEDLSSKEAGLTEAVWAAIRSEYNGVLKTPYGVLVGNLNDTRQVLNDYRTFSVREYWDRMQRSLGQGYLGMDPKPQQIAENASRTAKALDARYLSAVQGNKYHTESKHSNPLIFNVSEKKAFDLARGMAEKWLSKAGSQAEVTIPLRMLLADVFAGLSHKWFGVPYKTTPPEAGRETVKGLIAVAGYVFNPNPIELVKTQAEAAGKALAIGANEYVKQGRKKKSARVGEVSAPLFNLIADDGQLARTVAGIAQGFMAPTSVSFFFTMHNLIKTGQLWRLQQSLAAHQDTREWVNKVLRPTLVKFMQRSPSPDQIHRTAIQDTELSGVQIKAGDRVVLGLISATREQPDSTEILFGGDYGKKNAPVHSCPGQPMAMGALLGMICAILEAGKLTPHPFPLTLSLSK